MFSFHKLRRRDTKKIVAEARLTSRFRPTPIGAAERCVICTRVPMYKKSMLVPCLIAALTVLISSTAKADSWVLWTKTEYMKTNLQSSVFWEIINARPDYNQCLEVKKKIWQVKKSQAVEDKKKYETISEIKEVPNELLITTFRDPKDTISVLVNLYCLLGTLDPRERK